MAPAVVLAGFRPSRGTVRVARGLAAVAFLLGAIGVLVHVISNHDAGVLDFRYATTWPTMSELQRWWLASTGGVGPTPSLAPMSLAFGAILVLPASSGCPFEPRPRDLLHSDRPGSGTMTLRPRSSDG